MKTIAERIKAKRSSPYKEAARLFGVTEHYVYMIADGSRKATRGKGRKIKEWLEKQISK